MGISNRETMGASGSADLNLYGCDRSEFAASPESFLTSIFTEGSDSATFTFCGKQVVAVRGLEGAKLFYDPESPVSTVGALPAHLQVLLGAGTHPACSSILFMEGDKHDNAKKELMNALSNERLESNCAEAARLIQAGTDSWRGSTGSASHLTNQLAFEISAGIVLGARTPSKVQQLQSITAGLSLFDMGADPMVAAVVRDALLGYILEETKESDVELSSEGSGAPECVLDVMMHCCDSITCDEVSIVAAHLFLVIWQGLARGGLSIIQALQANSTLLGELNAEVSASKEKHACKNVCESVQKGSSKQVSFFVKEIKRTTLLAPLPWRRLTEGYAFQSEHFESGTVVCLATHLVHADAAQYKDPQSFDPSRFSKERAEDKLNSGWCWLPHGTNSKNKGHRCVSEDIMSTALKMLSAAVVSQKWSLNGDELTVE